MDTEYFQDFMPGDTCFGCGTANPHGLRIRSFWRGDSAICLWQPESKYQGWSNLTCGGVIATLVDCHCIATAMASAIRSENRALSSQPQYLFATGSMNIKFLQPSPIDKKLELRAHVTAVKDARKYTLHCAVFSNEIQTAEAQVVAFLVYRSDQRQTTAAAFTGSQKQSARPSTNDN